MDPEMLTGQESLSGLHCADMLPLSTGGGRLGLGGSCVWSDRLQVGQQELYLLGTVPLGRGGVPGNLLCRSKRI